MKTKLSQDIVLTGNSIAIAGEFAVLAQLALRGYDASMTLGRTKNVDILASFPQNGRMVKLEVKTRYGNNTIQSKLFGNALEWIMSVKHENIIDENLFFCFVNIRNEDASLFRYFLVPSSVVSNYVKRQHQFYRTRNALTGRSTSMRKFRLGLGDKDTYPIETPLASEYEDRWDLLSSWLPISKTTT